MFSRTLPDPCGLVISTIRSMSAGSTWMSLRTGECQNRDAKGSERGSGVVVDELTHPLRVDLDELHAHGILGGLHDLSDPLALCPFDIVTKETKKPAEGLRECCGQTAGLPPKNVLASSRRAREKNGASELGHPHGKLDGDQRAGAVADDESVDTAKAWVLSHRMQRSFRVVHVVHEAGRVEVASALADASRVESNAAHPTPSEVLGHLLHHVDLLLRHVGVAVERAGSAEQECYRSRPTAECGCGVHERPGECGVVDVEVKAFFGRHDVAEVLH